MKIAITGATGFVGGHLARQLSLDGHQLLFISRGGHPKSGPVPPGVHSIAGDLSDCDRLAADFSGYDAIAHCAGIDREIGTQSYERVHVQATRNVVAAARRARVGKIVLMSFLRARPDCGSPYHESKWAAEELVRKSELDYTIVKAGIVYGRGDHMLDHLSRSLRSLPVFATVGLTERPIRPLAIEDLVAILTAALTGGELSRKTVAVTGPEELYLSEAVKRVAGVLGRRVFIVPSPLWFQYGLAQLFEWTMKVPLIAKAQVRILAEGIVEPPCSCDSLPSHLVPTRKFTDARIRSGLPADGAFTCRDLRCCS